MFNSTEMKELQEKIEKLESRILDLELDNEMFCDGLSTQRVKVNYVVRALLRDLGYLVVYKDVILEKEKK